MSRDGPAWDPRLNQLGRIRITQAAAGPALLTLLSVSSDGTRWSDPSEALIDTGAATTILYPRSDADAVGIKLSSRHELRLESADGHQFRAWGEYAWVRLFEPGEHWQCEVPVYFAEVPEPLIGLELLMHYFRIQATSDAWTLTPKRAATAGLKLPLRRRRRAPER